MSNAKYTYSYAKANYHRLRAKFAKEGKKFSLFMFKEKKTANPEYVKEYRKQNRDEHLSYRREYYMRNAERLKKYHREYKKSRPWCWRYYHYKNIFVEDFKLTKFELKKLWERDKGYNMKLPKLEKENLDIPFTFENSVFIDGKK